jgi:hypothetical protein
MMIGQLAHLDVLEDLLARRCLPNLAKNPKLHGVAPTEFGDV